METVYCAEAGGFFLFNFESSKQQDLTFESANKEDSEYCEVFARLRYISSSADEGGIISILSAALFSSFMASIASQKPEPLNAFLSERGDQAVDFIGMFFPQDPEFYAYKQRYVRMAILSALNAHSISYDGPPRVFLGPLDRDGLDGTVQIEPVNSAGPSYHRSARRSFNTAREANDVI